MLEGAAAQQPVGRDRLSPHGPRPGRPFSLGLADKVDEGGVIEEGVDGLEEVVLDQGRLTREGHVEERCLVRGRAQH